MTNRFVRLEFVGSFLAGVLAILLASAVMALAHAPQAGRAHPGTALKIQQVHYRQPLVLARKRGGQGHRCRAQFTYCKPGAKSGAAEVVVCRPARRGPACTVVSDGVKQVFCQFAFACGLDGPRRPLHAALTKRVGRISKPVPAGKFAAKHPAAPAQTDLGHGPKIDAANIALLRVVR